LLLRPNRRRWARYVAVRWPAYADAWRRLPRANAQARTALRAYVRAHPSEFFR